MSNALEMKSFEGFEDLSEQEMYMVDGGNAGNIVLGVVQIVGGIALIGAGGIACIGGAALLAVPEPTMITKVAGWGILVAGSGSIVTGGTLIDNGIQNIKRG